VGYDPAARAKAKDIALKIAVQADATVAAVSNPTNQGVVEMVRERLTVKDAGIDWTRKKTEPLDTVIPVQIVVSDSAWSEALEYGKGVTGRLPATNFLGLAARAWAGRGIVYYRRRNRG
jgi:hypothetical protein